MVDFKRSGHQMSKQFDDALSELVRSVDDTLFQAAKRLAENDNLRADEATVLVTTTTLGLLVRISHMAIHVKAETAPDELLDQCIHAFWDQIRKSIEGNSDGKEVTS